MDLPQMSSLQTPARARISHQEVFNRKGPLYKDFLIHVIVPAYNEERFVSRVIDTIPSFVDKIIIVDDCSRDNTFKVVTSHPEPRLLVLQTPRNAGVGAAMTMGYQKAVELGGQVLVKMDGDAQMPIEYLPPLLDSIIDKGYDYAKGNRFLHNEAITQMPSSRIFGNIVLTFLTKAASGYWHIFDPQNGYTAIRGDVVASLGLEKVAHRFFFENDMLVRLNIQNYRVADVAMPAQYGDEQSHLRISTVMLTFPFLLLRRFAYRIYQKYILRNFSPVALFLLLGFPMFLWGILFGLYLWVRSMITGASTPTGSIMLALVPIVLGFQLLLQSVVLDIQETPK